MGLLDSRQSRDIWFEQAVNQLGESEVDAVQSWWANGHLNIQESYDFTYQSAIHARTLGAGSRSHLYEIECQWLAQVIRSRLSEKCDGGVIVEVGSGVGAAAAAMSRVLKLPVVAVDSHPMAEHRAREMADACGAMVEAYTGQVEDIPSMLGGRVPLAVYMTSTMRHLQPHQHEELFTFRWAQQMKASRERTQPTSTMIALLDLARGAPILCSENACADYVAEVDAAGTKLGYGIANSDLTILRGMVLGEETRYTGMVLERQEQPQPVETLADAFAVPRSSLYTGLHLQNVEAEATRMSLHDAVPVEGHEVVYADGSGVARREVSTTHEFVLSYISNS